MLGKGSQSPVHTATCVKCGEAGSPPYEPPYSHYDYHVKQKVDANRARSELELEYPLEAGRAEKLA